MPRKQFPAGLEAALRDLVAWLKKCRVRGVLIGGVAASLVGRPRFTLDLDALVVVAEPAWEDFLTAGAGFGFVPRRRDCLSFARKARVLLVRHEPHALDVYIVLGLLPFEEEIVRRATRAKVGRVTVPLPTPEDLIAIKALAGRPRDKADIEGIVATNPRLNRRRVLAVARDLSAALDMPGLLPELYGLLDRRPSAK